ncbi:hypothetical protein B0H13DRAFT_808493 [Mycena leptocephala]|nr:hypothetical protein B0H13DRAFT_808493 [Mycena leptocephala]
MYILILILAFVPPSPPSCMGIVCNVVCRHVSRFFYLFLSPQSPSFLSLIFPYLHAHLFASLEHTYARYLATGVFYYVVTFFFFLLAA